MNDSQKRNVFAQLKGIRKILLGIRRGFLIRNTSQGIQKPANEWNSESKIVLASTACMGRNVW